FSVYITLTKTSQIYIDGLSKIMENCSFKYIFICIMGNQYSLSSVPIRIEYESRTIFFGNTGSINAR
ncbi:hypothetical protein PENTCL1PPCAC_7502, partial [Pristionchus entomophagus]